MLNSVENDTFSLFSSKNWKGQGRIGEQVKKWTTFTFQGYCILKFLYFDVLMFMFYWILSMYKQDSLFCFYSFEQGREEPDSSLTGFIM